MLRRDCIHSVFLCAALVVGHAEAAAQTPPTPTVRAESSVDDDYYDVSGRTADEVFASIGKKHLGSVPGRSASGLTQSRFEYSIETLTSQQAPCQITKLTLRLNVDVTLPRHGERSALSQDMRRNWDIYETAVELHEYRHVEIELRGLDEVSARLERGIASQPITGNEKGACRRYVDRILHEQREITKRRHEDFHREDRRIVRNLQRKATADVERLDLQLGELDGRVKALDLAIEEANREREALDTQLSDLLAGFGTILPEPQFSRAREIQAISQQLLDEINGTIETRNALVREHRELIEIRRRAAEDLSWIR